MFNKSIAFIWVLTEGMLGFAFPVTLAANLYWK